MRAAIMHSPGDIRLEDVPKPKVGTGEVLLRVAAVGVCGSDIPRMLTKGAHRMPIVCTATNSPDISPRSARASKASRKASWSASPRSSLAGSATNAPPAIFRAAAIMTISAVVERPIPNSSLCRSAISSKAPKG